jgi:hypothetical protein
MEYQKKVTDTVRKLVKRKQLSLWERRPSVILLAELEDAIKRLIYMFLNPVRAGLVVTIDHYPGLSTWNAFKTCEACSLPRYILEDCLGIADPIITQTDLSAYVGSVITLETCPGICWTVSETDITTSSSNVYKDGEFIDCPVCLANTIPFTCVTFTNTTSEEENFDVVTYEGVVTKYIVGANSTLPKSCLISWNLPVGIVVTEYGNCTNGVCPAPAPQPKRKVTPGYNTPACTPAYYENVECNFSEWMYKDVLERRYGISSCCVEELMKWEIKHEMLMLDALINPDYVCQPTSSCCNPPTPVGCTSCGCSSCNCNN